MRIIILLILVVHIFPLRAQIVSDRTNSIVVDLEKQKGISTALPNITWSYPAMEYTNSVEQKVVIKAEVNSTVPLSAIDINITSGKGEGTRSGSKVSIEEDSYQVPVEKNLYLMEGENTVEIIAENENGGIVSQSRSIMVGMDAITDAVAIDRQDYALLIATDKYDYWNDLVNPVYDANSIAKELEGRYGFNVEVVENAEQDEVFIKLREYAQRKYKPQDQLMIFFAGHGHYDEVYGEGYLVARNSLAKDEGKTSYISHNRLRSNINNIPCEHIFLVMDVCFGGTFDPVLASSRSVYDETNNREYLVKKLSKKTRKYLTSGSKEYVSDGVAGSHSPFAVKFLEGLKTNGGDDRILVLDEMKLHMERLPTTPRFGKFGEDETGSDFVFVYN